MFEDCKEEEEDEEWPLAIIKHDARHAMWMLCGTLGVDCRGVPGQACRLLERYLAVQMHNFSNLAPGTVVAQGPTFKRQLLRKLPVLMVSCIQLAAKMNSAYFQMNASFIRVCLIFKGVRLTVDEIKESEFRVYSTLGFRIPLWTSVEAGEALAVAAGMPQEMLEGVALLVNLAEYRRDRLNGRVWWASNLSPPSPNFARVGLRTVHLAAGSVAAAARQLSYCGPDPAPRLAELTRAPLCYVRCISNCLLTELLAGDAGSGVSSSRKRKRQD
ncbi:uncharacterized protein LOC114366184 [Ostrinia furnacalis]|uniref:uncharacterized protein LOC114366184 n=1 Tax=Ostrinia furnacalis TaxID=93504 RepID=UPI00103DC164|nr:uncharacterized protein LOC114366184 [Ostrinia furnacalis]